MSFNIITKKVTMQTHLPISKIRQISFIKYKTIYDLF